MRTIYVLIAFLSGIIYGPAQGTWERNTVPITRSLNSVFFTDSITGWAVGDSGTIIHTGNGGNTWTLQDAQTTNDIMDVYFLNRNLGWASSYQFATVPYQTIMLKTVNGGETWTSSPYPLDDRFITCILFLDSLTGWVGGRPHVLAKTTDGGLTWHEAAVDTSQLAFFPVLNISFYNKKYGYACGGIFDVAGVIWRTNNGGEKWYACDGADAPADEVRQVYFYDSINVIGAGGDPDVAGVGMIRTNNGGLNWVYEELGIQGTAYDLDFRTENDAWAPLGAQRKFIYSQDAGTTWNVLATPDSSSVFDVIFPDSLHGYAVGRDGVMLRYKPSTTGIHDLTYVTESRLTNFPNPFRLETNVTIRLPEVPPSSKTEIFVYDLSGQEVRKVAAEIRDNGSWQATFLRNTLNPGMYLYRCFVDDKELATTGKMIILP